MAQHSWVPLSTPPAGYCTGTENSRRDEQSNARRGSRLQPGTQSLAYLPAVADARALARAEVIGHLDDVRLRIGLWISRRSPQLRVLALLRRGRLLCLQRLARWGGRRARRHRRVSCTLRVLHHRQLALACARVSRFLARGSIQELASGVQTAAAGSRCPSRPVSSWQRAGAAKCRPKRRSRLEATSLLLSLVSARAKWLHRRELVAANCRSGPSPSFQSLFETPCFVAWF